MDNCRDVVAAHDIYQRPLVSKIDARWSAGVGTLMASAALFGFSRLSVPDSGADVLNAVSHGQHLGSDVSYWTQILPFVFLPISEGRIVSAIVTIALLICLGIGRARIAKRNPVRTVLETVSIGLAAAMAGVAIGVLINHAFNG